MAEAVDALTPLALREGTAVNGSKEYSPNSPRNVNGYTVMGKDENGGERYSGQGTHSAKRLQGEVPNAIKVPLAVVISRPLIIEKADYAGAPKCLRPLQDASFLVKRMRQIYMEIPNEQAMTIQTVLTCVRYAVEEGEIESSLQTKFIELGGLRALLKLSRKAIGNRDVQIGVHSLIYVISRDDPSFQVKVGEMQSIQLIIHAMLKFKEDLELLNCAILTLLFLTPSVENRKLIGTFFGIEVTLSSLKTFPDDCELHRNGFALLANAACQNAANKGIICKVGGIKSILKGMKRCKQDSLVAIWGCLTLRNIACGDREAQDRIGQQGGIKAILIALITFKEDIEVQDQGCAALRNIMEEHDLNQRALIEMRGLEVLVRCMKRFRTIIAIHESCVASMKDIVRLNPLGAYKMAAAGAVEAILSSMIQYRFMKNLQSDCIAVLDAMARIGGEIKGKIVASGGVETINATLRVHLLQLDLVEAGVALQRCLRDRERL